MSHSFEILGRIRDIEVIAEGKSLRSIQWLRQEFGPGKWRKMKGVATIRYLDGLVLQAELHWYEAHGIGQVDMKVKKEL
jgi:hypothetical protein